jgi:hypothetical protein
VTFDASDLVLKFSNFVWDLLKNLLNEIKRPINSVD